MNGKLIDTEISYQVNLNHNNQFNRVRNFSVYSDAERYVLNKDNYKFSSVEITSATITEIETKTYIVEKVIRVIDPLAPKPDIVILEDWTVHPHEKGPYLSGFATNHPNWPTIPRKGMSTGHIIGKKGELIVTEAGTKYDLQTKRLFEETIKKTLLACLVKL